MRSRSSVARSRETRRQSSSLGLGGTVMAQTRGSPRCQAISVRRSVSPSIASVLARRWRRGTAIDAGAGQCHPLARARVGAAATATQRIEPLAIQYRQVQDLIPYARNARTHSPAQVAEIAGSIREFGFTNPVLIDPEGGIIAGHGRVLASPNGLQTGIADRNARRFPFASASTLRGSTRRRFCRAYSPSLLGCNRFPPEPCQNTLCDFQLIVFAAPAE